MYNNKFIYVLISNLCISVYTLKFVSIMLARIERLQCTYSELVYTVSFPPPHEKKTTPGVVLQHA